MARPRIIPDDQVFAVILHLLVTGGDKAVSLAAVAQATGLAAPTLVQRYGTRERMIRAALADHWTRQTAALPGAEAAAKGATAFLRALSVGHDAALLAATGRDATLRGHAATWRAGVEAALARLLGSGSRSREGAQILFAAWQGLALWPDAADKPAKIKDIVRRLG